MNGDKRKHEKDGAMTKSAGEEKKQDNLTREGVHADTTLRAPLVRFDASMRASANAQASDKLLPKKSRKILLCTSC
jgi:hypothetical protein